MLEERSKNRQNWSGKTLTISTVLPIFLWSFADFTKQLPRPPDSTLDTSCTMYDAKPLLPPLTFKICCSFLILTILCPCRIIFSPDIDTLAIKSGRYLLCSGSLIRGRFGYVVPCLYGGPVSVISPSFRLITYTSYTITPHIPMFKWPLWKSTRHWKHKSFGHTHEVVGLFQSFLVFPCHIERISTFCYVVLCEMFSNSRSLLNNHMSFGGFAIHRNESKIE